MQYLNKEQIINETEKIFTAFTQLCNAVSENKFYVSPPGKWSVAENIKHLVISTNTSALAYTLPAFIIRWVGGKPNRHSRSYEQLVGKYKSKLAEGGKASGIFIPKKIDSNTGKEILIKHWQNAAQKFIKALKNKRTSEIKLDDYLARHPLLGRITLRELCYFTIYHTEHHLEIIKKLTVYPESSRN